MKLLKILMWFQFQYIKLSIFVLSRLGVSNPRATGHNQAVVYSQPGCTSGGPVGMRAQLDSHERQAGMHAYAVKLRVHVHARRPPLERPGSPFPPSAGLPSRKDWGSLV